MSGESTYKTECGTLPAQACPAGGQGAALLGSPVRSTLPGLSRLASSTDRGGRRPEAAFPSLLCIFPELPSLRVTGSHSRGINRRRRRLPHRCQVGVKRTGGVTPGARRPSHRQLNNWESAPRRTLDIARLDRPAPAQSTGSGSRGVPDSDSSRSVTLERRGGVESAALRTGGGFSACFGGGARPRLSRHSVWRVTGPVGCRGGGRRAGRAESGELPSVCGSGAGSFRAVRSPLPFTASGFLRTRTSQVPRARGEPAAASADQLRAGSLWDGLEKRGGFQSSPPSVLRVHLPGQRDPILVSPFPGESPAAGVPCGFTRGK